MNQIRGLFEREAEHPDVQMEIRGRPGCVPGGGTIPGCDQIPPRDVRHDGGPP